MSLLLPALALAMEPPEPDVMKRPPRPSQKPILGSDDFRKIALQGGALSLGALAAYGYGLARYGPGARAGTLAFMGMSMAQPLHALSARSERTSFLREKMTGKESPIAASSDLYLSIGGTLLLQSAALFIPGARSLLGLAPVSLLDGAVIAGSAALPFLINEAFKESPATPAPPPERVIAGPAIEAPSPL
jgi:Ca2+-transporting ATPase